MERPVGVGFRIAAMCAACGMATIAGAALTGCDDARSDAAGADVSCVETPADRAPVDGECTAVDWDVVSVDGASVTIEYFVNDPGCSGALDRVDVVEDADTVMVTVLVEYRGGGSCPTSVATRETVVELPSPLGDRALHGCRPANSFVPAGGYDAARPGTDANLDCRAGT